MPQLLDQFGRAIAPLKRPETREIASVSIRDRWSEYPSRGLTPGRLASILSAADVGELRLQAQLFEEMEEKDPHLMSVMQTRRLAVLGLDHQVEADSKDAVDVEIADFCRGVLEDMDCNALLTHLLGAIGHGYAGAEPKWRTDAKKWTIGGFNLIHPKSVTWLNSLTPLVVTEDQPQGVEPKAFQMIFHRHLAKSGYVFRNGVLRVCAWSYLFKNYSVKDWVAFNEIFGMPLRLGKYEPSASPADREALRQAITMLGTDAAGIISKSTEIEFVEAAQRLTGATNPYETLINYLDRLMSKAVLGQNLTTDTTGGTGTFAAASVQNEVRRDLLEADARNLAETVRLQILRPLVGFNFGWDRPVPGFSLLIQDSPDLKSDSEVLKNLATVPGACERIPASYINEHFGIPAPGKGETVLGTPPPAPPASSGGQPPAPMRLIALGNERYDFAHNNLGEFGSLPQDRRVIEAHREQDALTQKALALSAQVILEALAPVWAFIEAGKSMEEIKGGLLAVYPDIHPEGLAALLYQAGMLAWMKGRSGEISQ